MAEQRYLIAPEFPPKAPVVVVWFHGLMVSCYNKQGFYEVGLHNHTEDHNLEIGICARDGSFSYHYPIGKADHLKDNVEIQIDGAAADVSFLQTENPPFDRAAGKGDPNDFRWVLDLEGNDFYNQRVKVHSDRVRPRIRVHHGVVHTLQKTNGVDFYRHGGKVDNKPLGNIAVLVGANMYPTAKQNVVVSMGPQKWVVTGDSPSTYDIFIGNSCNCPFDPDDHSHKENRNDFYQYFHVIDKPREPEYELIKASGNSKGTMRLPECMAKFHDKLGPVVNFDSPCGAIFLGQTDDLG